MGNLKLYVWEGVLTDWSSGMAFALAESEEEAWKMVERDLESYEVTDLRENCPHPTEYTTPMAKCIWGGG